MTYIELIEETYLNNKIQQEFFIQMPYKLCYFLYLEININKQFQHVVKIPIQRNLDLILTINVKINKVNTLA